MATDDNGNHDIYLQAWKGVTGTRLAPAWAYRADSNGRPVT
jgi:hypothetical protein